MRDCRPAMSPWPPPPPAEPSGGSRDHLVDALEGRQAQPPQTDTAAVYAKLDPGPHPADQGKATAALNPLKTTLRRVVHQQLIEDLERLGHSGSEVALDWRYARRGKRTQAAHDGEMATYTGLRVLDAQGEVLHKGRVNFLRDELAETFFCWWDEGEIPQRVWDQLDMGVRGVFERTRPSRGMPVSRPAGRVNRESLTLAKVADLELPLHKPSVAAVDHQLSWSRIQQARRPPAPPHDRPTARYEAMRNPKVVLPPSASSASCTRCSLSASAHGLIRMSTAGS